MYRPRRINEVKQGSAADEEHYQCQPRRPVRVRELGYEPEYDRPDPRRATFRYFVNSKEGRFPAERYHLGEKGPRQCLRTAKHKTDGAAQYVCLRELLKVPARLAPDRGPDLQLKQNRSI